MESPIWNTRNIDKYWSAVTSQEHDIFYSQLFLKPVRRNSRTMFQPEKHGLEPDFQLTKFTTHTGWSCKIPQKVLEKYLRGTEIENKNNDGYLIGERYYFV